MKPTLLQQVGMALRRVPVLKVKRCLKKAAKHGIEVSMDQIETQYLAGGDSDKVIDTVIRMKMENFDADWLTVSAWDLAGVDFSGDLKQKIISFREQIPNSDNFNSEEDFRESLKSELTALKLECKKSIKRRIIHFIIIFFLCMVLGHFFSNLPVRHRALMLIGALIFFEITPKSKQKQSPDASTLYKCPYCRKKYEGIELKSFTLPLSEEKWLCPRCFRRNMISSILGLIFLGSLMVVGLFVIIPIMIEEGGSSWVLDETIFAIFFVLLISFCVKALIVAFRQKA